MGHGQGLFGHFLRSIQGDSEQGFHRHQLATGQLCYPPRLLGPQVPQGAVDTIATATRGQVDHAGRFYQLTGVTLDEGRQLGRHRPDGLAQVIHPHGLGMARQSGLRKGHRQHIDVGYHLTGGDEGRLQRPSPGLDAELQSGGPRPTNSTSSPFMGWRRGSKHGSPVW